MECLPKTPSKTISLKNRTLYREPYSDEDIKKKTKDSGISGSSESTPKKKNGCSKIPHKSSPSHYKIDLQSLLINNEDPFKTSEEDNDEDGNNSDSQNQRLNFKKRKLYRKSRPKKTPLSSKLSFSTDKLASSSSDEGKTQRISFSLPATPSLFRPLVATSNLIAVRDRNVSLSSSGSCFRRSLSSGKLIPNICPVLAFQENKQSLTKKLKNKAKKVSTSESQKLSVTTETTKKQKIKPILNSVKIVSNVKVTTKAAIKSSVASISKKRKESRRNDKSSKSPIERGKDTALQQKISNDVKKKKLNKDAINATVEPSPEEDLKSSENSVPIIQKPECNQEDKSQNDDNDGEESVCHDINHLNLSLRRNSRPDYARSYILSRSLPNKEVPNHSSDTKVEEQCSKESEKFENSMLRASQDYDFNVKSGIQLEESKVVKDSPNQNKMYLKNLSKMATKKNSKEKKICFHREPPHISAAKKFLRLRKNKIKSCRGSGSLKEYSKYVKGGGIVPQSILDPEMGVDSEVYAIMMDEKHRKEEIENLKVLNDIFGDDGQGKFSLDPIPSSSPSIEDATLSSQIAYITQKINDINLKDKPTDLKTFKISDTPFDPSLMFDSSTLSTVSIAPAVDSTAGRASSIVTTAESGYGSRIMTEESSTAQISGSVTPSIAMDSSRTLGDISLSEGILDRKNNVNDVFENKEDLSIEVPPEDYSESVNLLDNMFNIKNTNGESFIPKPPSPIYPESDAFNDVNYMTGINSLDLFIDPLEVFSSDRHPALKKIMANLKKTKEEKVAILQKEREKAAERNNLQNALLRLKKQRKQEENMRDALLNKAKELRSRAESHKEKLAVLWIDKFNEEKLKTTPLDEVINALRKELDEENKKRMDTFDLKMKPIIIKDGPSRKANYKIAAAKLHYEIYEMSVRLRHTALRAEQEEQIRELCEAEVKRLREEISEKKLAITTVTKGIPSNRIEVRPEFQLPQVTDPYLLLQSYHRIPTFSMISTRSSFNKHHNMTTSSKNTFKPLPSTSSSGSKYVPTSNNGQHG
ncbi:uncharacterized protein [Lepeophtheirus salmonis]|uniref:uncharacterized protein isoform X1 n=1 Tax=Lepeophtheirus salmonis TaxID=72036 RepID=UPI001AE43ED9|nr:uncharacterized protein LOC121127916 isoform X1 [Lepeophtheirus salmonis]